MQDSPTSSVGERVCAARKKAADLHLMLKQLHDSCGQLDIMCATDPEPTDESELQAVRKELRDAVRCMVSVRARLERVQW